jgi:O-antigen ligase
VAQTSTIVKIVIVGVTLALAWYWGQTPSMSYVWYVVALSGIVVVLRYPQLGLLVLVPIAFFVPYAFGTGTQTDLNLAFLGIPVLWAILFVRPVIYGRTWDALVTRESWPLVGLTVTAAVSLVAGYLPWNPFAQLAPVRAQFGALAIFAFTAGACMVVPVILDHKRWIQMLVWIFLGIAALYLLGRTVPVLGFIDRWIVTASTGSMFWVWLIALAAGLALFNRGLDLRLRYLLFALVVVAFVVAFANAENRTWASGWVPALASLAVLLLLRWPRIAISIGLLATFVVLLNFQSVEKTLLEGENAYSLLTRSLAFQILWQVIQANPLLGVGPANYYYYTPLYSILGYYVKFNSHNQYIDLLAQSGLLGLLFFVWFVVEMIRTMWKLRRKNTLDHFGYAYINASLAGLIGMLVAGGLGDWLIPFVYNVGVSGFRSSVVGWLFLGGVLLYKRLEDKKDREAAPRETLAQAPSLTIV